MYGLEIKGLKSYHPLNIRMIQPLQALNFDQMNLHTLALMAEEADFVFSFFFGGGTSNFES